MSLSLETNKQHPRTSSTSFWQPMMMFPRSRRALLTGPSTQVSYQPRQLLFVVVSVNLTALVFDCCVVNDGRTLLSVLCACTCSAWLCVISTSHPAVLNPNFEIITRVMFQTNYR